MPTIYEQLSAAWQSTDRQRDLNHTVERLAATSTLKELGEGLLKLLRYAREAGANDETEEIITSVSDRLHGWVHVQHRIECSPKDSQLSNGTHLRASAPLSSSLVQNSPD